MTAASKTTQNPFAMLAKINVNGKTEKKGGGRNGGFTYLSWAFAVEELMTADPMANWVIHEPKYYGQQVMVSCTVTAFDKPIYMWLPVMNHANAPINNPSVTDINKAQMRCLVKAIACHGLGLYIYAGEDLPDKNEPQAVQGTQAQYLRPTLEPDRFNDACLAVQEGRFDKVRLLTEFSLTPQQHQYAQHL